MTRVSKLKLWLSGLGLCAPPCLHLWRPARTSKGAARVCKICDHVEQLEEAMFFAYFGRISR